jgi:predicted transcriptional regulator
MALSSRILDAIEASGPVTVKALCQRFPGEKYNAIHTCVARLVDNGLVRREWNGYIVIEYLPDLPFRPDKIFKRPAGSSPKVKIVHVKSLLK